MKLSDMKSPDKFKLGEKVWYSPPKGDFVTIDTCKAYLNEDGDSLDGSAYEWCVQLHGDLEWFVENTFATYFGFIYLFSRRYCSYHVELEEFMKDNGYDAVFVDRDGFYFCGEEVENCHMTPDEVYDEDSVGFCAEDYGDDCLGWHDSYYVHYGKLFKLEEY